MGEVIKLHCANEPGKEVKRRKEKLEELKRQVENGELRIDYMKLAEKILKSGDLDD